MENFFVGSNIMAMRILMQVTICNNVFICIHTGLDLLDADWHTLKVDNLINYHFCLVWKFGERITRRSCHSESAISDWRGLIALEWHSFPFCTCKSSDTYFQQSAMIIFRELFRNDWQSSASISKTLF